MACCFYLSLFNEYVAELLEAQTASKSRTLRVYYIHITWKQPNWFFFLIFFFFSTSSLNLAASLVVVTGVRLTALEIEKLSGVMTPAMGGESTLPSSPDAYFASNHLSVGQMQSLAICFWYSGLCCWWIGFQKLGLIFLSSYQHGVMPVWSLSLLWPERY